MQLELKHISPYLPYGLKGVYNKTPFDGKYTKGLMTLSFDEFKYFLGNCKPLLRPLSDLTKEIEHNGEKFVPSEKLLDSSMLQYTDDIRMLRHGDVEKLHEWHFDVFGLIENGLAIDINTLND